MKSKKVVSKTVLSLTLLTLLITLICPANMMANTEKEAKFAEKVKANVTKLGVGSDAKIEVKLKNGTKLKGYVSEINEASFKVISENRGTASEVPYQQVKQVKGNNLSKGVKIAIAYIILFVIFILPTALSNDGV